VQLALGAAVFHPLLILWVAWRLVAWRPASTTSWVRAVARLACEGAGAVAVAALLSSAVSGALHGGRFLFERFLCQGLFTEGALFLGVAAASLLARVGLAAGAVPLVGLGILLWGYWEGHYHGPNTLRTYEHTLVRSASS
jgi:hypothetical protein